MRDVGERTCRNRRASKIGAACGVGGSLCLLAGTLLHPMSADPAQPLAAFAEYAADRFWIASHLSQAFGVFLIVAALIVLARQVYTVTASPWCIVAGGGAVATLAVTAALQAVDGIALKAMVDIWAATPAAQKDVAFSSALAVRQIEIGLASMSCLVFGLTAGLYGAVLVGDHRYPKWISGLAFTGGTLMIAADGLHGFFGTHHGDQYAGNGAAARVDRRDCMRDVADNPSWTAGARRLKHRSLGQTDGSVVKNWSRLHRAEM
jgi:hypothetical protein